MSDTRTVVVWGDSIAAGGWPALAERVLRVVAHPGFEVTVVNEGIGGMPAAKARDEFDTRILPHAPDLVVIQFGLNDLRHDGSRPGSPVSTPEEFRRHTGWMIDACRDRAGARVLVFGNHRARSLLVMPTGLTYDETRALYSEEARAAAEQRNVRFVDMAERITVPPDDAMPWLAADGVHLSDAGAAAYAQVAAAEIAACLSSRA